MVAVLAGLAAWGQAAAGVSLIDSEGTAANAVFRRTAITDAGTPPLFVFASPTAYSGYAAYAGLPATDGCHAAANVTGTKGEAITFARASTRFCPADHATEATGVMCASGQVCLVGRRVGLFNTATNAALRSQQFENAAWVATNATVTADTDVAPDGTTTGDTITDADGTNSGAVCQSITTNTAAKWNLSVWLKAGTLAKATITVTGTGNSAGDQSCGLTGISSTSWRRYACTSATAYTGSVSAVAVCVVAGTAGSDQGTVSAWGFMATKDDNEAVLGPYVATTSVTVNRAGETLSIPWSTAALAAAGSGSADIFHHTATTGSYATILGLGTAGRIGYAGYATGKMRIYDGAFELELASVIASPRVTHFAFQWGVGGNMSLKNVTDTESATHSFDGSMTTGASVGIGYSADNGAQNGYVGNVCLSTSTTECYQ